MYYAAKRHQNDVHKLKIRNVLLCFKTISERCPQVDAQTCHIMLQNDITTMSTNCSSEMSYYAAKRHEKDVHKLKLKNVVCWRVKSWKLQGLQRKCPIMLQNDIRPMSTNWSFKTGSRRQSRKIAILKRFLVKGLGKSSIPKSEKLDEKTLLHNLLEISHYACV